MDDNQEHVLAIKRGICELLVSIDVEVDGKDLVELCICDLGSHYKGFMTLIFIRENAPT